MAKDEVAQVAATAPAGDVPEPTNIGGDKANA